MRNKLLLALLTVGSLMLFTGCKGEKMPDSIKVSDVAKQTLYIKADGTNQIAYIEDFKENYYNVDELKGFIISELNEYNKKYGNDVATVTEMEKDGEKVKVILTFTNNKAYAEFSKAKSENPISYPAFNRLFSEYGDADFNAQGDGGIKKGKEAIDSEKHNVVIVKGPIVLMTEKEIQFYSTGKLLDPHKLDLVDGEEAVVVFSR